MFQQDSNIEPIQFLAIDDDPIQLKLLEATLKGIGYYSLETSLTAEEGLAKLRNHMPDILLLDLQLPDKNGLAVLEELKPILAEGKLKVIVLSSNREDEIVIQALSLGATDYVFKADNDKILKARILNVVRHVDLEKKLFKSLKNIEADIDLAREIQMGIVPLQDSYSSQNLDFGMIYLAAEYVSGDIYDIYKMDENHFRIFLADATGHGIQAALVTMSIKTEYDRLKISHRDICKIIDELNTSIFATFSHMTLYTCFILDIDLEKGEIVYTSSGHNDQVLYQAGKITELPATNPIIGYSEKSVAKSERLILDKDFCIYLFTDGCYEFFDTEGNLYGEKRLYELLERISGMPARDRTINFVTELYELMGYSGFRDDLSFISISPVIVDSTQGN